MQLEVLGTPCSPAPDIVQEGVLSLHSEGQQCHLWGHGTQGRNCQLPLCPPSPHILILTVPEFRYFFFFIFFRGFTTCRDERRGKGAACHRDRRPQGAL